MDCAIGGTISCPARKRRGSVQEKLQIGGVRDDVGFLKFLVADLVRRGVSDPKRIYLAGFSNGGFMTLRMICTNSGLFAAVGLLASGMPEGLGPIAVHLSRSPR